MKIQDQQAQRVITICLLRHLDRANITYFRNPLLKGGGERWNYDYL